MASGTWDEWRPWLAERAGELKASIAFLTRLPLLRTAPPEAPALAQAAWAFPLAGLAVGVIAAAVYALTHHFLGLPPWPAAALTVAAVMAATGCLHEDGLADTADGFGGGGDREQKLAIMRDHHIGAYGVSALVLSILLRAAAVASLAATGPVAAGLIAAHAAARATLPAVMFLVAPARSDGLSFGAGRPPAAAALIAALLGFVVLLFGLGLARAFIAAVMLAIVTALIARLSERQIGGQTGDVLGAVEQVGEIVVLLVAVG